MARRYTKEQWTNWIEQQPQSGLSVTAYCRSVGISRSSFYSWRKRLTQPQTETQETIPVTNPEPTTTNPVEETSIEDAQPSATTTIDLSGSHSVADASRIHEQVKSAVTSGDQVQFDCQETLNIDASILQIMLAAKQALTGELFAGATTSDNLTSILNRAGTETLLEAHSA